MMLQNRAATKPIEWPQRPHTHKDSTFGIFRSKTNEHAEDPKRHALQDPYVPAPHQIPFTTPQLPYLMKTITPLVEIHGRIVMFTWSGPLLSCFGCMRLLAWLLAWGLLAWARHRMIAVFSSTQNQKVPFRKPRHTYRDIYMYVYVWTHPLRIRCCRPSWFLSCALLQCQRTSNMRS